MNQRTAERSGRGSRLRLIAACAATGALLAISLPPWGWWPLAFPGVAIVDRLLADRPWRSRFGRGWLIGMGLFLPSLIWMQDLTLPGYVVACIGYSAMIGGGAAACPPQQPWRWLALPGGLAFAELLRWSWPFGGVPLSTLAIGQVAGPLAPVLRIGGALLLLEVTVVGGVVLAALWARRGRAAGVAAAGLAVAIAVAAVAPRGHAVGEASVALVQGGGPQGTRAEDTDERVVFERHLAANDGVELPVDVVFWPEDVVDVDGPVVDAREGDELAALARAMDAPLVAGVVEGSFIDGREHFHNAAVVFDTDGETVSRYEKVHRVPFGEYVPLRSILEKVAGDDLISAEAIEGEGPAVIEVPGVGRIATAISWEIFFGDRVREGVQRGATLIANPTNGSSFSGTFVQTQQVASSRMRALETGRSVVQIAPTGFTAIVRPDGTVVGRTSVSERAVVQGVVELRSGETWYVRLGLLPGVALALLGLAAAWTGAVTQTSDPRGSR